MEISTYCAYTDGINIWLPSEDLNALFYYKLEGVESAVYLHSFKESKNFNAWKIGNVLRFEESLFFFSRYAYEVWIFNLFTQKMEKVKYYSGGRCFVPDVVQVGNEAWVMTRSFMTPIIVFNLSTWHSEEVGWGEKEGVSDEYAFIYACEENSQIYFTTRTPRNIHLCKIDCRSRKIQYKKLYNINFINCLTVYEESIYALVLDSNNKAALKRYKVWDMSEENSIKMEKIDANWIDAKMFYFRMFRFQNYIIVLPGFAQNIVIYDISTKEESNIFLPDELFYRYKNTSKPYFSKSSVLGEKLYLYSPYGKYLWIVNLNSFEFKLKRIYCKEDNFWKKYAESQAGISDLMVESVHLSIGDYFNYIVNIENISDKNREPGCGKLIYDLAHKLK